MKKAIILCGGWDGHQPKQVSQRFSKMLSTEGYEVTLIENLKDFAKANLSKYDLIVPIWTMAADAPINNTVVKNISNAVLAGAGLAGCHGGIIDAFRQSTDWQFMTGAQWVYHGEQRKYEVKYTDNDSIFTKGLKEFSLHGEQYYCHIDPACKVYAYSEYPNEDYMTQGNGDYKMPAIITRNYGKGKVFVFMCGHQDAEFDIPEVGEIMRRGLLWASGENKIEQKTFNIKNLGSIKAESVKTFTPVDKNNGKLKVAVIGCGNISGIYFDNLTKVFKNVEIIGCFDLMTEKAVSAQQKYNIPRLYKSDIEACSDKDVDIILNLTFPKAHYAVNKMALEHGKHVYVEKPLALTFEQGFDLLKIAEAKGLYIGGAPDTFMGNGIQTAIKTIEKDVIGRPIAGTAFMTCRGHEGWHPSPEFYYEEGGGPLLDMGPYYITALVSMLGAIEKVNGFAGISFPERTITSAPKNGKKIKVETPTHIAGLLQFKCGAIVSIVMSFDIYAANLPVIEIYGSKGSMTVPDPNGFSGDVKVNIGGKSEKKISILPPFVKNERFSTVPLVEGYSQNSRGLGLSDMARAIQEKNSARAGIQLTAHVLETMLGILEASKTGKEYVLKTTCEKPKTL